MECILLALFLVLIIALLLGFGMGGGGRSSRSAAAYEQLAASFKGTVYRTGWFGHPRVMFRYRSASALVGIFPYGIHPGDSGPVTQLQVEWPDARQQILIVHPPRVSRLTSTDGLREWRTNRAGFDSLYSIRTSDPGAMAGLLSEPVQLLAERLRRTPRNGSLMIEVQRGVFRISKATAIRRSQDLQDFVRSGLELYDQALLGATEGIEFLDGQAAQLLEHVMCSVCGEEICEDLVFCRRCKTPHHRECWLYAGRCSVFGCGETQFDTPRAAQRIIRSGDENGAT